MQQGTMKNVYSCVRRKQIQYTLIRQLLQELPDQGIHELYLQMAPRGITRAEWVVIGSTLLHQLLLLRSNVTWPCKVASTISKHSNCLLVLTRDNTDRTRSGQVSFSNFFCPIIDIGISLVMQ